MARTTWVAAVLAAAAVALAACSTADGLPTMSAVDGTTLTAHEVRYGMSPHPEPGVTLRPEVVLVGGGAESVRSVTADGLTWTLDPGAENVADLRVGDVMFATGRGVGRVVDVAAHDGDVAVTIAPVGLTDVIQDGDFSSGDTPISLDNPLAYTAVDAFWASAPAARISDTGGGSAGEDATAPPASGGLAPRGAAKAVPIVRWAGATPEPSIPAERVALPEPSVGAARAVSAGGLRIAPVCCTDGVGVTASYDENGMRFAAQMMLHLQAPRASFRLSIRGAKVTEASLRLTGGAGVSYSVDAATISGLEGNLSRTLMVPVDFSIPVGLVLGIPFSLTVTQTFTIKTAFSAKNSRLASSGRWDFTGDVGYGYAGGRFTPFVPGQFRVRESILHSLEGASVGVNGIVLAHKVRFSIGLGGLGFSAGLWASLAGAIGVIRGSDIGIVRCQGATLRIDGQVGIGYRIPQVVADVVNFFLRVFRTRPIQSHSELELNPPVVIANRSATYPPKAICGVGS